MTTILVREREGGGMVAGRVHVAGRLISRVMPTVLRQRFAGMSTTRSSSASWVPPPSSHRFATRLEAPVAADLRAKRYSRAVVGLGSSACPRKSRIRVDLPACSGVD